MTDVATRRGSRGAAAAPARAGAPAPTLTSSAVSATVLVTKPSHAEPVPVLAAWRERDQVARRLEPHEAAVGGREPDRARAVGRRGGRAQPGGDGRGASAARSGRAATGVPRVARDAERRTLGLAHDRQLGQIRLAEDHRTCGAQPANQLPVTGGRFGIGRRTPRRDLAREILAVLDGDRHAEERALTVVRAGRAAGVGLLCVRERPLVQHGPEGVQLRIEALYPFEVQLGDLLRGDLSGADQLGLPDDAGEGDLLGTQSPQADWRTTKMCSTSPR